MNVLNNDTPQTPEKSSLKEVLCAFTPDQLNGLNDRARGLGLSRSAVLRLAVADYLGKESSHAYNSGRS